MTPRSFLLIPALTALSACMSLTPEVDQSAPVSTMSAPLEIVPPEGPYLYACAVQGVDSGTQWQFSIVEQANETGSETLMETAGVNAAYPLNQRSEMGTETFLAGNDRIIIAPDGSVQLYWAGAQSVPNYTGQCQSGTAA